MDGELSAANAERHRKTSDGVSSADTIDLTTRSGRNPYPECHFQMTDDLADQMARMHIGALAEQGVIPSWPAPPVTPSSFHEHSLDPKACIMFFDTTEQRNEFMQWFTLWACAANPT